MVNQFGNLFNIEIFGGSHTETLGVIINGVPKEFVVTPDDLYQDIKRRQPGAKGTTTRKETDEPIIDRLEDGRLRIMFYNKNIDNHVYNQFVDQPRPSHADYTQYHKYGPEYDMTGGGMASGRMTLPLVAAGTVAKMLFRDHFHENISFTSSIYSLNGITNLNPIKMECILNDAIEKQTSIGAVIECVVKDVPKFIGEPFFDSIESIISHLAFSVPGIKGIEFGDGFSGTSKYGHDRNDCIIDKDGHTKTNNEGGINGGISNGNDIIFRLAVKPTASIFRDQETYNFKEGKITKLKIQGRHDACIGLRVPVIAESIAAIALMSLYVMK